MKKYKFKLDGLLKLREFREHQEKVKLSQINQQITDIDNKVVDVTHEIELAYKSQQELTESGIDGQFLSFYPMYIKAKKDLIQQLQAQKQQLLKTHSLQVKILSQKRGDVKVIEKVKHKDHEKFKKEKAKKIQEDIDDIIMMRQVVKSNERA